MQPEETIALAQRVTLKAIVEGCLVLEEQVSTAREIDLGMTLGAGFPPGPFAGADAWGLDTVVQELEKLAVDVHPEFEPPTILRRLVSQGRLGVKSGHGFYPYPQPDNPADGGVVKLDTRGNVAIAWLDRPPANSLSPDLLDELAAVWQRVEADSEVRVLVIASANRQLFSAGADLKAFAGMQGPDPVRAFAAKTHALMQAMEAGNTVTIAMVNAPTYGGGCELAMACDVRIAAQSATFSQPEIDLGIIPGFGGTQRLIRLMGYAKAMEMNLLGQPITASEAYAYGLANHVVTDHELFDTTMNWARKFAGQAPLALGAVKRSMLAAGGGLKPGLDAELEQFVAVLQTQDAIEGMSAFFGKRSPQWQGR